MRVVAPILAALLVVLGWFVTRDAVVCVPAFAGPRGDAATMLPGAWQLTSEAGANEVLTLTPSGGWRWVTLSGDLEGLGTRQRTGPPLTWTVDSGVLSVERTGIPPALWDVTETALTVDFFGGEHPSRYRRVWCVGR